LIWKNRDRIKSLFKTETPPPPSKPNEASSFENLSEDMKAKYHAFGTDVDVYTSVMDSDSSVSFDDDAEKDKDIKAEMLR
jgi:hypothetical protein